MFNITNLIFMADSYKSSHNFKGGSQFPPGTTETFYYVESRGGKYDTVMVAGIQLLCGLLSKGICRFDVEEASRLMGLHFGREIFNYDDWLYLVDELCGNIPLEIKCVAEGVVMPTKNVIATIRTTDPRLFWLAGFFEDLILRGIWYPTTVATESFEAKKIIVDYLRKTTDGDVIHDVLPFMLHDFGMRGASSSESSMIGGMSHLYNFKGTDNIEALVGIKQLFGDECAAFSIPAREHSTTTTWEDEDDAFWNSIDAWGDGMYACVMDSYDYEAALERITTGKFKEEIIKRGGRFVIRPDSGKPVDVVMSALRAVERNVGVTVNDKGYKVLHPSYRVIQGDGIDVDEIARILNWMESNKFSAENVAFGMGGGLLQHMNRDTQRFAMKCSAIKINGEWRGVCKNPKTDPGKKSKAGLLSCQLGVNGIYTSSTLNWNIYTIPNSSMMKTYFKNGKVAHKSTLEDIRVRSDLYTVINGSPNLHSALNK